jgi:Winged helix DNA-binding domain
MGSTRVTGAADVLGPRALNRALLARQLLLERGAMTVEDAVEHLVGLQAQAPDAPYVGLWTRLAGFDPHTLASAVRDRRVVRAPMMRATIHLVTTRDAVRLRPAVQRALDTSFAGSPFAPAVAGVDTGELHAAARALLAERPRTRAELAELLGERWPDRDSLSLAYAITYRLPVVQVPPRGVWRATGAAAWTSTEAWLAGGDEPPAQTVEDVVVRYLEAFGPATVKDAQTWSGLTRLREVVDRLGPRLRRFRDEAGTELLDLPEAPRPDPDVPAPPRFLPEYDNVLLSHADRSRVNPERHRIPLYPGNGAALGTVLVDGVFRGTWKLSRDGDAGDAVLDVRPFGRLGPADTEAVTDEGARLLDLIAPEGATIRDVRIVG